MSHQAKQYTSSDSGAGHGTITTYATGFVLSVIFTLLAYWAVVNKIFERRELIAVIVGLAFAQLMVQLLFFLHLGRESKPRWNLTVFFFMVMVVCIVIIGSLWIMSNLDYHMMPQQMNEYMLQQNMKGF